MICPFCSYTFPDECGRYGCPNCLGEGLDDMTVDRSQAADKRRREERIAKIEAWEKFQSGEEFTAREIADLICKCTSENAPRGNCGCPSRARDLLDYMPNVQKRATTKHTLYSKTPVKMSTVDWRVNKNIYREIENEARGY